MIARGFKSVIWVATVGGAALACYMVSLQVATERSELEKVERQIIAAKQDIRSLQTELGTRGRLSQLEHWNAEVLALSAPNSSQFLKNEFTLARLEQPEPTLEEQAAEMHLASLETGAAKPAAPAPVPAPVQTAAVPQAKPVLVHRASLSTPAAPIAVKAGPTAKPALKTETPKRVAKAEAEVAPSVKAPKPAKAAAKPEASRPARLGSKLATEIGAAASKETGKSGDGR
ncbi:MAG TPA: hypothetical protein VGB59_12755 [Allosphingosinicella sp.]|jgi:hypothetical protein